MTGKEWISLEDGVICGEGLDWERSEIKRKTGLIDYRLNFSARKMGYLLKLAVWGPSQLVHLGSFFLILEQFLAWYRPEYFTHLGSWPQYKLECPNRWHVKH